MRLHQDVTAALVNVKGSVGEFLAKPLTRPRQPAHNDNAMQGTCGLAPKADTYVGLTNLLDVDGVGVFAPVVRKTP